MERDVTGVAMNRRTIPFVITTVVAIVEWLCFELLRTPYRPPNDMSSLLGTEKYAVLPVMGVIVVGWLICLVISLVSRPLTRTGYISFAIWLACLISGFGLIVYCPPWPVTPYDLIWK